MIIASVLSIVLVYFCNKNDDEYVTRDMGIYMLIMLVSLFYFALRYKSKLGKVFFTLEILIVMFFCGVRVNPLREGISVIYDSPIIQKTAHLLFQLYYPL